MPNEVEWSGVCVLCAATECSITRQYCERSNYYYYIFTFSFLRSRRSHSLIARLGSVVSAFRMRFFGRCFCSIPFFGLFVFVLLWRAFVSRARHRIGEPFQLLVRISLEPAAIRNDRTFRCQLLLVEFIVFFPIFLKSDQVVFVTFSFKRG